MSDHHDSAIPCPSAEFLSSRLARICSLRVDKLLATMCSMVFLDAILSPILITSRIMTNEMRRTMAKTHVGRMALILLTIVLGTYGSARAEPYELSKNDVMEPKTISSAEISLFGVKLGDSETKAVDTLVNEKISGIKAEQEATFIFLLDQRKPTGPMAGVRIQDGKVDLLFINNRFAYKTRGIFRNVLNSESPEDIRKLLGQEEYGDENVMGAVMAYDKQGFQVNYLGKDVNIEFAPPR